VLEPLPGLEGAPPIVAAPVGAKGADDVEVDAHTQSQPVPQAELNLHGDLATPTAEPAEATAPVAEPDADAAAVAVAKADAEEAPVGASGADSKGGPASQPASEKARLEALAKAAAEMSAAADRTRDSKPVGASWLAPAQPVVDKKPVANSARQIPGVVPGLVFLVVTVVLIMGLLLVMGSFRIP